MRLWIFFFVLGSLLFWIHKRKNISSFFLARRLFIVSFCYFRFLKIADEKSIHTRNISQITRRQQIERKTFFFASADGLIAKITRKLTADVWRSPPRLIGQLTSLNSGGGLEILKTFLQATAETTFERVQNTTTQEILNWDLNERVVSRESESRSQIFLQTSFLGVPFSNTGAHTRWCSSRTIHCQLIEETFFFSHISLVTQFSALTDDDKDLAWRSDNTRFYWTLVWSHWKLLRGARSWPTKASDLCNFVAQFMWTLHFAAFSANN